jgi:hypothetical protein
MWYAFCQSDYSVSTTRGLLNRSAQISVYNQIVAAMVGDHESVLFGGANGL